ncbi:TIGR04222 domain-containing membrane protein [Nonomuraea typhae]|uniref:TIGR04222 domain-containing membrane protein n=1 Tax=Nonomuraea typhae TaxID=2603600 RepID=A0ABW7YX53_9ACTN
MDVFLVVVALALVILVSRLTNGVRAHRLKVAGATLSQAGHRLTPYELAYLAGGPRRAINTALAVLATAGAVRVSRLAQVSPVQGARYAQEPLEQAVLDAVAMRPGARAAELRAMLERGPALLALEERLRAAGLLLAEGAQAPALLRLERVRLAAWVAAGFEISVLLLAAAGVVGLEYGFFGALFLGGYAAFMGFSEYRKEKRMLRNLVSAEGRRVLAAARQHHPSGSGDTSSVALYGMDELGDRDLCHGLSAGDPGADCRGSCGAHSDSGSSSFGGSDSSSSFSDGGGGGSSCSSSSSSCGGGSSS